MVLIAISYFFYPSRISDRAIQRYQALYSIEHLVSGRQESFSWRSLCDRGLHLLDTFGRFLLYTQKVRQEVSVR